MHKAELVIFDKTYPILDFELTLEKEADTTGLPVSNPFGGKMTITFASSKDDTDLIEAAMASRMMVRGIVRMYRRDGIQKLFDYEFANAYLLLRKETFDATSKNPLTTKIIIAPGILKKEDWIFENYWNPSNPFLTAAAPISSSDDVVPQITSLQWVNSDTEEQDISSISYKENASLLAVIENAEGGTATITIEKEDGTEFENGQKQLSFTEAIDENGMVELTPMEIKEQWEEFKTSDMDKLVAKVSHGEAAKTSRPLIITPKPKVTLHFRPHNAWIGEYGFDWMRIKDTSLGGDTDYKLNVGEYGAITATRPGAVFTPKDFTDLEKEYKPNDLDGRKDAAGNKIKYYTPKLSIYREPNIATPPFAELELLTDVDVAPDELYIEYSKKHFEITGAIDSPTDNTLKQYKLPASMMGITVAGTPNKTTVQLKCINTFSKDETIKVWAAKKKSDGTLDIPILSGLLTAKANSKAHRYKADIVFVKVRTDLAGLGGLGKIGSDSGEQVFLEKYLKQALIKPNILATELDLRKDIVLNSTYKLTVGTKVQIKDIAGIHVHLETEFDKIHPGFKKHFKVFFFDEKGGEILTNAAGVSYYEGYNGAARKINCKEVVLYNTHNPSTTTHEILHAMGLEHSFDNGSTHTFKINETDNIMDYSHNVGINRVSTWSWQWKTIYPNVTKE